MGTMEKGGKCSTKNLAANCQVCGREAEIHCFGVSTCNECRQFFHEQSKKNTIGSCKKKQCFVEKTKKSFWKVSSGCRSCRYERMIFLGMLELKKMKQAAHVPVNTVSNVIESFANNGTASPAPDEPCTSKSSEEGFLRCKVCEGKENVSKRYGVYVCNTCVCFFLRSWKEVNKTPLQCLLQGESEGFCPLRKDSPPMCRFCRVKRCVELDMKCQLPLTTNSPVDEMMKMLDTTPADYSDFADQPLPDLENPLFGPVKEEVQEEEQQFAIDNSVSLRDTAMSYTDMADVYDPDRCPVCTTFTISSNSVYGSPACILCQMFFGYCCKAEANINITCADKNCDISISSTMKEGVCPLCRLLRCLQVGMIAPPECIERGSPMHIIMVKGALNAWTWLDGKTPKQKLSKKMPDIPSREPADWEDHICAVGREISEDLTTVAPGVRVCNTCKSFFFTGCVDNEEKEYPICLNGNCDVSCNTMACRSCKLKRCIEVGMTTMGGRFSYIAQFFATWKLSEPVFNSKSSHIAQFPVNECWTHPATCKVCKTYPVNHHGHPVCTACQLFFMRSYKEEATFAADCATKTCDLRGHASHCSFCRLLQCLKIGMTVQPGDITKGSHIHRILIAGKEDGWKWLNKIPPAQILPQFLENDTPCEVSTRRAMCDVGMSFCNGNLKEVGNGIRICSKCKKFFDGCLVEQKGEFKVCTTGCHLTCHRTPCASCKLKRCLEVGLAGIWKKNSFFAYFLSNWNDKQLPEKDKEFCACGRLIEGDYRDECMMCVTEKLLKKVKEELKNGEEEKGERESQVDRLCREGLAARLPASESSQSDLSVEVVQIDSSDQEMDSETSDHSQMIIELGGDDQIPIDPEESMANNRKRKLSESDAESSPKVPHKIAVGEALGVCLVCDRTDEVKQRYGTIVCLQCSWFFLASFTKQNDSYMCNRKKGDPSCDLIRKVDERQWCARCRLLKWISLNPLLPKLPVPTSPLQNIINFEQVAELIPEETRKGSFRVDTIKDNLKLAQEKLFGKGENTRQRMNFEEVDADSYEEGSICDENVSEEKKEEEVEDLREEWLKRDVKSPCAVCGTVRRPREKTLGPPACLRCVTFVSECWIKKFCPDSLKCLKMTGKVGECSLSWKFRLCVYCQLRRSLNVGCAMDNDPAVESVVYALLHGNFEVESAVEPEEIKQKEDSSINNDDIEGLDAFGGGACAGCGDLRSSIHYNVPMCHACHSFIRNSMRTTAIFHPCLCINKAIGACSRDIHPILGKYCSYCRLKRLLSCGIRLCNENIKGTPVQQMIWLEKINVEFVSGGSYTSKSSMIQVQTENCEVCLHHKAVTHFHSVFLCRGCRTFIMNQWISNYALYCLNPLDSEKCKQLIAQQCQLCRLLSCIRVGARSNGQPSQNSFILRLCPGYPEKKEINEDLLKVVVNKSIQRQMTVAGSRTSRTAIAPQELPEQLVDVKEEDPNIILACSSQCSSVSLVLQDDAISAESLLGVGDEGEEESVLQPVAKNEETMAEDGDRGLKDHAFDLEKDIPQKIADFFASFTHWLKPIDKMNSRASLEKMDCMRGWKCIMTELEPFFEAFQEWSDTVGWMQKLSVNDRDEILSASCMEGAALIACYMLVLHSCIPYDEDKLLFLPDLIQLLEETSHTEEVKILTSLLECASQMKKLGIMNHTLPLLLNIIMVDNADYDQEIVDEYYRECEEFICKQNLEAHGLVILDVFIGKLNNVGKLFRKALQDFCTRRNTTIITFPPLVKKFLKLQ